MIRKKMKTSSKYLLNIYTNQKDQTFIQIKFM